MNNIYLNNSYILSLISFIFSSIATYLMVYPVNKVGYKYGFLDRLDSRKDYREKIVRVGGICIVTGALISLLLTRFLLKNSLEPQLVYIVFFSFMFFLIEFSDDLLTIKRTSKTFFSNYLFNYCFVFL